MSRAVTVGAVVLGIVGLALAPGTMGSSQSFPGLNGKIVYVTDRAPNLRNSELYAVDREGSEPRTVEEAPFSEESDPAWSPDGRRLAFASNRGRDWEIYVRDADGSVARLTQSPGLDRLPTWSPDGTRLAFVSTRRGYFEIYVMNADGSGVTRVTTNEFRRPSPIHSGDTQPQDTAPSWSPDGRRIVFARVATPGAGIRSINADGSDERQLTRSSETGFGVVDLHPSWGPDGSRIAFVRAHFGGTFTTAPLWTMSPDGTDERPVPVQGASAVRWPAWSPDARAVAVTNGTDLVVVYLAGGQRTVSREAVWDSRPSWSPTGRELVFASMTTSSSYRLGLIQPEVGKLASLRRPPGVSDWFASPTWSPDGERIAFVEGYTVAVMDGDGSRMRLFRSTPPAAGPAWAPDGARIVFSSGARADGPHDLYVVNADGKGLRRLTRSPVHETNPDWSPDGRQIVFESRQLTRQARLPGDIEVMNADGTGRRRLTDTRVSEDSPAWSPSGELIAFSSGRTEGRFNPEIWVMKADGSEQRRVVEAVSPDRQTWWSDYTPSWSPDGNWIVYSGGPWRDIWIVLLDASQRFNLTSDWRTQDVSPDWQPICAVRGSGGRDQLQGAAQDELLCGLAGDDAIRAGDGADTVIGGSGRDTVVGDAGDDRLFGSEGDDSVDARDGARDVVDCGPGRDLALADVADVVAGCERVSRL